jgi:hypothetical protein
MQANDQLLLPGKNSNITKRDPLVGRQQAFLDKKLLALITDQKVRKRGIGQGQDSQRIVLTN